jgi:3'-5' exoribonuclease
VSDTGSKVTWLLSEIRNTRLFEAGSETSPAARVLFIRDLDDGQNVESVFLVNQRSLHKKKNGEDFLRLTLRDCTGTLAAVCWEDAASLHELASPGVVVRVAGRYEVSDRWGPQLTLQKLAVAAETEYRLADLTDGPLLDVGQMERDLRSLIATVRNVHLRRLLDELFGESSEVWQRFRAAPAAKFYHQAYGHGLLEHTLSVGQGVSAISACFPGVDRDVAVTGALVHDIGKVEAYGLAAPAIDLTDEGKLHGEIPLGYYLVRSRIEQIDGFPPELARAVLHILLSHHGTLENGSPVTPSTREATIVHAVDNLGGKLGSFDRLEKGLQEGERWSQYDRALSGSAHFPLSEGPAPELVPAEQPLPAASGE